MAPKSGGATRSAGQRIGEGSVLSPGSETPGASINELANAVRGEMNSDPSGVALGAFEAIAGVLHTYVYTIQRLDWNHSNQNHIHLLLSPTVYHEWTVFYRRKVLPTHTRILSICPTKFC